MPVYLVTADLNCKAGHEPDIEILDWLAADNEIGTQIDVTDL